MRKHKEDQPRHGRLACPRGTSYKRTLTLSVKVSRLLANADSAESKTTIGGFAMNTGPKVGIVVVGAVALAGVVAGVNGITPTDIYCSGDGYKCLTGVCKIPVTVMACAAPASGNYGQLDVQKQFSICKPRKIAWRLDDHAFKFPSDGISFKASSPDFSNLHDSDGSDWKYTYDDAHKNTGPFPYTVIVQKSDGSACAQLDPVIYNE